MRVPAGRAGDEVEPVIRSQLPALRVTEDIDTRRRQPELSREAGRQVAEPDEGFTRPDCVQVLGLRLDAQRREVRCIADADLAERVGQPVPVAS